MQALTRARVPIVKLMDPDTGLSCDICVNNLLAVVNTKLLKDYAQIDERLRQLAFIVKHWARSRRVNETYQGTLSSYAWVVSSLIHGQMSFFFACTGLVLMLIMNFDFFPAMCWCAFTFYNYEDLQFFLVYRYAGFCFLHGLEWYMQEICFLRFRFVIC